jgi:hypothetical protein
MSTLGKPVVERYKGKVFPIYFRTYAAFDMDGRRTLAAHGHYSFLFCGTANGSSVRAEVILQHHEN